MGDDTIKCFFCGFSLSKTNQGADPQRAHSTFRPTCEQSKKKRVRFLIQYNFDNPFIYKTTGRFSYEDFEKKTSANNNCT